MIHIIIIVIVIVIVIIIIIIVVVVIVVIVIIIIIIISSSSSSSSSSYINYYIVIKKIDLDQPGRKCFIQRHTQHILFYRYKDLPDSSTTELHLTSLDQPDVSCLPFHWAILHPQNIHH